MVPSCGAVLAGGDLSPEGSRGSRTTSPRCRAGSRHVGVCESDLRGQDFTGSRVRGGPTEGRVARTLKKLSLPPSPQALRPLEKTQFAAPRGYCLWS